MTLFRTMAMVALASGSVQAQGVIGGTVSGADGRPVESATVRAVRTDRSIAKDAVTDLAGKFRLAAVPVGTYTITVQRVGYRRAELPGVRVADGETRTLNVTLTQAPTQLSTIEVVTSPTSVDAASPALTMRLDRSFTELLPSARDASSLIALVPGSRKDQLWGGAPGVANNYQVDGVSMNHPGLGGDFLAMSVDWIESLEIKGLGAGAEYGNFQGGIINAVTKSGSNTFSAALRTNYESPKFTATNFNANEIGSEQAGRREVSGEVRGPILHDRLFYFAGLQLISRDVRSPDLTTKADHDFQRTLEEHRDARGIAKITWAPSAGQRFDALGGLSWFGAEHVGVNGVDDPAALLRARQPVNYFVLSYTNAVRSRAVIDARLASFTSAESRLSYEGPNVPGVQMLQLGRAPSFQNAAFDQQTKSSSTSGSIQLRTSGRVWLDHELIIGGDFRIAAWRDDRSRNGGLTWRPYGDSPTVFDRGSPTTWKTVGSDWGGERHINSTMGDRALFVQDNISLGPRLTVTPGLRRGWWTGSLLMPWDERCCGGPVVTATAVDRRLGASWDVTGRNTLAIKAHWGRYHQGMYSSLFDRADGLEVYNNSRFYYSAPRLSDSRRTYSTTDRATTFSPFYDETILNETGRVTNYHQPLVDQRVFAVEKSIGARWKVEGMYTRRVNMYIAGLVDLNRATNYSPINNVGVDNRFVLGRVLDVYGKALRLPVVWVSNQDLKATLNSCGPNGNGPCVNIFTGVPSKIGGYTYLDVANFTWNPDLVLTTVPEATREYKQLTFLVRTVQVWWRAEGSLSLARLRGNTPGVMGYGTTGSELSAGPFVRPNEAINFDGTLPDAQEIDAKVWATARLPWSFQAGALWTHTYGETFAPTFEVNARYEYKDAQGVLLPSSLFKRVLGQNLFIEPRGSRHYPSRDVVDLHLEWRSPGRVSVTMDLFNALGDNGITLINTNIGDRTAIDPTSYFAATRMRSAPRTLRAGLRVD